MNTGLGNKRTRLLDFPPAAATLICGEPLRLV
jgi:hypothetical protein